MTTPKPGEIGGAAYWLWEQSEEVDRSANRLTNDIAELESKIVEARAKRDRLLLVRAEMLAARNLIEVAGLKVERRGRDVVVSVERRFEPDTDERCIADCACAGGQPYRRCTFQPGCIRCEPSRVTPAEPQP